VVIPLKAQSSTNKNSHFLAFKRLSILCETQRLSQTTFVKQVKTFYPMGVIFGVPLVDCHSQTPGLDPPLVLNIYKKARCKFYHSLEYNENIAE